MEAILLAVAEGRLKNVIPKIVISSNHKAPGLKKAEMMGIPTEVISSSVKGWEYDKKIVTVLNRNHVDPENGLVCLAGFMRILSHEFIKIYHMRILNIHPSLLPSFPGLHAQKQSLEYGVKVAGCTVHFVDAGIDTGPIIAQSTVNIQDDDTEELLSEKILNREHDLYVECIKLFADGKLSIHGRRVVLKP